MSMAVEMELVLEGMKPKVAAYADFGRRFDFVAGEFRSDAYFAECVDVSAAKLT